MTQEITQGRLPHGIQTSKIAAAATGAGTVDLGTVPVGMQWRIFAASVTLSVSNDGTDAYAQILADNDVLLPCNCADTTVGQVDSNSVAFALSGDDGIFLNAGEKVQLNVSAGRSQAVVLYQETPAP